MGKTNPFCKGGFPGPDSTKDHCYQQQSGTFHYDWNNYRLKMDLEVKQFPANITSDITHVKENMWIVNDLGLGVHQCICTAPGANLGIKIYPIKYDFMDPANAGMNVRFIGRENLFIEFIEKTMEVDHWTQGPHHIWLTRRLEESSGCGSHGMDLKSGTQNSGRCQSTRACSRCHQPTARSHGTNGPSNAMMMATRCLTLMALACQTSLISSCNECEGIN